MKPFRLFPIAQSASPETVPLFARARSRTAEFERRKLCAALAPLEATENRPRTRRHIFFAVHVDFELARTLILRGAPPCGRWTGRHQGSGLIVLVISELLVKAGAKLR